MLFGCFYRSPTPSCISSENNAKLYTLIRTLVDFTMSLSLSRGGIGKTGIYRDDNNDICEYVWRVRGSSTNGFYLKKVLKEKSTNQNLTAK